MTSYTLARTADELDGTDELDAPIQVNHVRAEGMQLRKSPRRFKKNAKKRKTV